MSAPRLRLATRAIVVDDAERILLVRFDFGDRIVWATPGGGIEPGETDDAALRREVLEEAGLEGFELGPLVWTRTHRVPLGGGRWDGQTERYYRRQRAAQSRRKVGGRAQPFCLAAVSACDSCIVGLLRVPTTSR